ncbi:MAG: DUF4399 domain-containing protein [Pseudomonadota bacterium]
MNRPIRLASAITVMTFGAIACSKAPDEAAVVDATSVDGDASAKLALPRSAAPEGARVYFVEPVDGASVTSPVTVVFGADDIAVVPAGDTTANSGHHHLLINTGLPDVTQPIPKDAQHVHFGMGQTDATIELPPGTHTLQMLLGDYLHIPHEPPITSDVITITVTE